MAKNAALPEMNEGKRLTNMGGLKKNEDFSFTYNKQIIMRYKDTILLSGFVFQLDNCCCKVSSLSSY